MVMKYFYWVKSVIWLGIVFESLVYIFCMVVGDEDVVFFVLIGDFQYNDKIFWAWNKIVNWVWEDCFYFIIYVGDFVDIGIKKLDWMEYFFLNGYIVMSCFLMYMVLGNYEQDV